MNNLKIPAMVALVLTLGAACSGHDENGHDTHDHAEHAGHDHGSSETQEPVDDHSGHDHAAMPAGNGITLDADARRIAGITLAEPEWKKISHTIDLPGRIGFDEDRLVHVTPRFGGIIRALHASVGARVAEGDVLALLENNGTMATYEVTAPISGRIIEKRAAIGEAAGDGEPIYVLADLARVWVNCDAYPADIGLLRPGMQAALATVGGEATATARISYIAPVFNTGSGTGLVRMVLSNGRLQWRPGMFVRARVRIPGSRNVATVASDAVQVIDGEPVVFVPGPAGSFFTRPVTIGLKGPEGTEIKRGLGPGEQYVATGAYELKATLVTGGMDPHAGHGH